MGSRPARYLAVAATVLRSPRPIDWAAVGLVAVLIALSLAVAASKGDWLDGRDFELYRVAAARWVGSGIFYGPDQLAGPYTLDHGAILYPPTGLLLFVPFTVLPAVIWWAVPLSVTALVVWQLRPNLLGLVAVGLVVAWPPTIVKISTGNPVIWVMAAVALGVRFGWPAVLVVLKPTLAPFALVGVRRRAWWVALGALAALSLPFGGLWLDWLTAVRNAESGSVYYSLAELPMVALPIFAEMTRTRAGPRRPLRGVRFRTCRPSTRRPG